VILISIDSLRADHVGAYGYDRNTTPNIDKMTKDSIVFKNYIAQSYLTPVSETSLHTSLYPSVHGYLSFAKLINPSNETGNDYLTLAQLLKIYGYQTAAYSSSPEISSPAKTSLPLNKSFDVFVDIPDRKLPPLTTISDWLDKNHDKKFFLYLAIGTVHQPFGENDETRFVEQYDPPNYSGLLKNVELNYPLFGRIYNSTYYNITSIHSIERESFPSILSDYNDSRPINEKFELGSRDISYIIGRYDVGVKTVDEYIGILFEKLRELNLDRNTIIVLTSEHGEGLGEHGYFWHYDIYDTEIHVPLIVKIPEHEGKEIEEQVQSIDIMPTILDMLGNTIPAQAEGTSAKSLIEGKISEFNKYVFIERPLWEERQSFNPHTDIAVRTKEWKLIYRKSADTLGKISLWSKVSNQTFNISKFELYNLKEDPMEQRNVFDENPEIASTMVQKVLEWDAKITKIVESKRINGNLTQIFPYP